MHVPRFDANDADHVRLSDISIAAHKQRNGTTISTILDNTLEEELADLVRRIAALDSKKSKSNRTGGG